MAIALTTTAIGTLMPILKERGLMGTPVGDSVLSYGTWGELAPIVAIALLLGTRAAWKSLLILILFIAVAVLTALRGKRITRQVKVANQYLGTGIHLNASTRVRIVVMLLVRGLPIMVALRLDPATYDMAFSSRTSVTLYCVTALPLIVAVTSVAVSAGTMSSDVASRRISGSTPGRP